MGVDIPRPGITPPTRGFINLKSGEEKIKLKVANFVWGKGDKMKDILNIFGLISPQISLSLESLGDVYKYSNFIFKRIPRFRLFCAT